MTDLFCISITNPTAETFDALSKVMVEVQDSWVLYAKGLAEELGVSDSCAYDILYLRERSRWSKALEDELIRRDKAGESAPNMCEYGC